GCDLGVQRVPHVEDEGTSSVVIVGEQHAAGGHRIFRVMDELGLLVCDECGHEATVGWRRWVGVDYCKKVVTLFRCVAGPGKHVVAGRSGLLLLARGRQVAEKDSEDESENNTRHARFHL